MMNEPKPFASLGPTLLARKGGARPAMRPQSFGSFERQSALAVEDLGWDDLGNEPEEPRSAEVLALTPSPTAPEIQPEPEVPAVRLQQEEIARQVAAAPAPQPVARAPVAAERRSALEDGRRAAFTLRVDAERHLKLRLACTIRNLSAQQLVTEALDRLLADIPDLDTLAARVQRG